MDKLDALAVWYAVADVMEEVGDYRYTVADVASASLDNLTHAFYDDTIDDERLIQAVRDFLPHVDSYEGCSRQLDDALELLRAALA